jgi:hypothetical protein
MMGRPPSAGFAPLLVLCPENIVQKFSVFRGASRPGLKPRVYRAQFILRALRRG